MLDLLLFRTKSTQSNKVHTFTVHSRPIQSAGLCVFFLKSDFKGFKAIGFLNYITPEIYVGNPNAQEVRCYNGKFREVK